MDEFRVARPVDLVEPAEIAEPGVVDQDVDRAAGEPGVPQRARGIGLAEPSAASSRAMAAPMPLDAPVTSALADVDGCVGTPIVLRVVPHARQLQHLHHDLALGAPTVDVGQSFVGVLKWEYLVDDRADGA